MKLFKYEGYRITISEEALALKPFKQIWSRDRSVNKEKAIMELGYIYFMEDPRSDYQYIVDRDSRSDSIREGEGIPKTWKPDKLITEAMEFYSHFKTTSALVIEDMRYAAEKLRAAARSVDLECIDDETKKVQAMNSLTNTLKQMASLVKVIDEAERAISKEIAQSDKVRGAQEKSMYEDL